MNELLTVVEAAEYLSLSAPTVRKLLKERQLPGIRLGRSWRLSRTALNEYLVAQSTLNLKKR